MGLVTIVLPAYHEEGVISRVVASIHNAMQASGNEYEVLVVDDGSVDRTSDEAFAAGARVIRHAYNMGNGAAIKTGIRHAHGDVVVFMDSDGQHDPLDIPRLLEHIDENGMVVGARTKESQSAWYRWIANEIYNSLASYICSFKIPDLTSGFRAIHTNLARRFLYLLPNTFSYPTTLTMAVFRSGHCVKYIPIQTADRVGKSKIKLLRDGSRFLLIIFKIATLYSPLKIFIPVSLIVATLSVLWYGITVYLVGPKLPPASIILMISSVLIFFMGLISEQISQVHYAFSENGPEDTSISEKIALTTQKQLVEDDLKLE
jgi:glycosyltransferase involved in cell wall biosynthesis